MRLYASVTSERATAGQGGNKALTIELTVTVNGKRCHYGSLVLNDQFVLTFAYPLGDSQIVATGAHVLIGTQEEAKGEKQKGENRICTFNACKNIACPESGYDICKLHFDQGIND